MKKAFNKKCGCSGNKKDADTSEGNMLWTCCACHQDVRASTLHTLSKRRSNHLRNAHPGEDRSKFNSIRVRPEEVMVADLPLHQRAWTCSKCRLGLPVMDVWLLRKWAMGHLAKCFKRKISMRENRKRLTAKSISHSKDGPELHHYSKDRIKRFAKVKARLEKKSGHKLVLVRERYAEGATLLTCTACTSLFGCMKRASRKCGGQKARVRNLTIKANWWAQKWKHDRATLVRMCQRWRLTEQEAKHAMERARLKCKRLTGGLTPLKKTEYIKDLTIDEDVEEHPGPSSLRCVTVNACGRDHAWKLLSAEYLDACDIMCVQELAMTSSQLTCFERQLQKFGFMVWASPAFKENGKTCHGLLLAVRQGYRVRHVASFAAHAGQFVALQVAGCVFLGVHHKPWITFGQSFEDEIASLVASLDPDQLWVGFGDWNALPNENFLQAVFHDDGATSVALTDNAGNWVPTRWRGRRAIDYAVTNTPVKLQCVTSWSTVFGDHKVIEFVLRVREKSEVAWSLPATCKYRCPDGLTGHDWTEALRQAWQALVTEVPDTDTEDEWCWFNRRLEEMFQHAGSKTSDAAGKRPKGTAAVMQPRRLEVTANNEGDKSTHLERKWRTLIGRLRHLQSLPERCTEQRRQLVDTIQRASFADVDVSQLPNRVSQTLAEAEKRLKEVTREAERQRLSSWRQRMRGNAAYKWLKGMMTCLPNHVFAPADPNAVSGTIGETLQYIKAHWRTIWDRATVAWSDVQASFRFPAARAHQFIVPSVSDLRQAAQRLRGRAAGLDGWHGDEVAAIPDEVWRVFQKLLEQWFQRARDGHDSPFPHDWRVIRQTHIPKTKAQEERQPWVALSVKDLRPISIECTFWRLLMGAIVHQQSFVDWIDTWRPPHAHGGLSALGVHTAVAALDKNFVDGTALVSQDFSEAFDRADPKIAIQALARAGMAPEVVAALEWVWPDQVRWLVVGQRVLPEAQRVTASLPQGDPMSPLGLLALLCGPTAEVMQTLQNHQHEASLVSYVDDRNTVVKTPEATAALINSWQDQSVRFGLKENVSKLKIVVKGGVATMRRFWDRLSRLIDLPASAQVRTCRALGVDFSAAATGVPLAVSETRLDEMERRAKRLCLLVQMRDRIQRLAEASLSSVASWGWWRRAPLKEHVKRFARAVRTGLRDKQTTWAKNLRSIILGHRLDAAFSMGFHAWSMFRAAFHAGFTSAWDLRLRTGSWLHRVNKWMHELGWQAQGSWQWAHVVQGVINWTGPNRTPAKRQDHLIRESWRQIQFESFRNCERRDAAQARALGVLRYDERRCKLARMAASQHGLHAAAVLAGGGVSDAVFSVMKGESVEMQCGWCQQASAATWHHLCWECGAFARGRPPEPSDFMQSRMAWPMGRDAEYDKQVIQHMMSVRSQTAEARHSIDTGR